MTAQESSKARVAVVDFGMGNLRSVEKALGRVGAAAIVTNDQEIIRESEGVVLPGVGAFPKAMRNLRELELDSLLAERLSIGVPTLGICLGMQLLFESSSEGEGALGLGFIQGRVERLSAVGKKVPHIGWNPVNWQKESRLTEKLVGATPFYFVHSYAPVVTNEEDVLATSEYGDTFVCAVERGPLSGLQCHPEKSSVDGLKLLENFVGLCEETSDCS